MEFFLLYLRQRRTVIFAFMLFFLIFAAAFLLYRLPFNAVAYPALICLALAAVLTVMDMRGAHQKQKRLREIASLSAALMEGVFPRVKSLDDAGYQEIIRLLRSEQNDLAELMTRRYSGMVDYYTSWAHQIKTPIASMRLQMQNDDSALSRRLSSDLFRIEQYVEMVLLFLRLDSDSTDYVFRQCELDPVIKQAVRKFRNEFILRKLRLQYQPIQTTVVTDEKWLSFVIEQVLSNALKYTPHGSISIELEAPKTLCIRDTGIGIAPEDLPRIFEKGYTGYNGREDKRASGIGLYLCRRICTNLGHVITASSSPDTGTEIRIDLAQRKLETE